MIRAITLALLLGFVSQSSWAVTVNAPDSTGAWLGFMNVSELPENGGGFVFASGWGVPDLVATFDDFSGQVTLTPNTIDDPNEFWYQNTTGTAADPMNPGGPGQRGNKTMEANLYVELTDDALAGQTFTFEGNIVSNTFTAAHEAFIFIRDFAPDYSAFNETIIPATPGPFSIDLLTDPGLGRHIQYGFQTVGENVWVTDTAPFGSVVITTGAGSPPTVPGDFDGDGFVGLSDLNILGANFNTMGGATLATGDADGDGNVTLADLNILGANWNPAPAVAVPEPSSFAVIALGSALLFAGGRRDN